MNDDQRTRLEIMRALEKDFPDRVLEDLIDVARYVEGEGADSGPEPVPSAQQLAEDGERIRNGLPPLHIKDHEPRKWASLADIPDNVLWVKDHDGDLIKRLSFERLTTWVYADSGYADLPLSDQDGPFTEVPS